MKKYLGKFASLCLVLSMLVGIMIPAALAADVESRAVLFCEHPYWMITEYKEIRALGTLKHRIVTWWSYFCPDCGHFYDTIVDESDVRCTLNVDKICIECAVRYR